MTDKGMTMSSARKVLKKAKYAKEHPHPNQLNLLLERLQKLSKVPPMQITKATWNSTSKEAKTQHDDGTCWLKVIKPNKKVELTPVYWCN